LDWPDEKIAPSLKVELGDGTCGETTIESRGSIYENDHVRVARDVPPETGDAHEPIGSRATSGRRVQFVTVERNIRPEVLDWGGSGRPVARLARPGNTAHVFDGFAEKLTNSCHVYGITRRDMGHPVVPIRNTLKSVSQTTSWQLYGQLDCAQATAGQKRRKKSYTQLVHTSPW
jgi:hypothetical protein